MRSRADSDHFDPPPDTTETMYFNFGAHRLLPPVIGATGVTWDAVHVFTDIPDSLPTDKPEDMAPLPDQITKGLWPQRTMLQVRDQQK